MDHPSSDRLRAAIAATRTHLDQVSPDEARYLERVAQNLEAILTREAQLMPAAMAATIQSFGAALDGVRPELTPTTGIAHEDRARWALDRAIADGQLVPSPELHATLQADAERRLAIARPGYERTA